MFHGLFSFSQIIALFTYLFCIHMGFCAWEHVWETEDIPHIGMCMKAKGQFVKPVPCFYHMSCGDQISSLAADPS